jgi:hypothetical protein
LKSINNAQEGSASLDPKPEPVFMPRIGVKMNQAEVLGHGLKLQHLMVAIAVAEWDSIAKAAKHLAISQRVVSKVMPISKICSACAHSIAVQGR